MGVDEKNMFSLRQCDSYNRMIVIAIGARSWGKTYQWKKKLLKNYLKKEEKGIYFRRFDSEIDEIKSNLFEDTSADFLDDNHDIICDTKNIYLKEKIEKKKADGQTNVKYLYEHMGYMLNMAKTQSVKSASYRSVSTFCFDEFLIEDSIHYYGKKEVLNFMGLISTINRKRTGNDKCRFYLFANAVTAYNPYFNFFNIKGLNDEQHYYLDFNPQVVVYYDRNETFTKQMKETEFGELIKGTVAEQYMIENKFLLDLNNDFIGEKPRYSKYCFTLINENKYYGVYFSAAEGRFWISKSYDKNFRWVFAAQGTDLKPNTILFKENMFFKYIKSAYRNGYLYYESMEVKKNLEDMLTLLNLS